MRPRRRGRARKRDKRTKLYGTGRSGRLAGRRAPSPTLRVADEGHNVLFRQIDDTFKLDLRPECTAGFMV
ncbi:hypothetical protein EVAR_65867_1 [Eumeta japonica]|uniref:Uncharacterized protein n=1 Tax=Eumeta variegata TaxID=151549 RepID=A0A4C1ZL60_EUMVA|nr:hypothetical protein EVAR_65867_1 [Eumeta japonica]